MNRGRATTWRMVIGELTEDGVVLRFVGDEQQHGGVTVHLTREAWESLGQPIAGRMVGPVVLDVEVTALWPSALELHKGEGTPVPTELAEVWTEGYRTGKSVPGDAEAVGTPYDEKPRTR